MRASQILCVADLSNLSFVWLNFQFSFSQKKRTKELQILIKSCRMSPDLTLIYQRIGRSSQTFPPTSKLSGSWEIDRTVHKTIAIYRSGMGSQIDSLLPCSIFLTHSQRFRFQKMAKSLTYLIWCPMWVNYLIINYVCPARPVLSFGFVHI